MNIDSLGEGKIDLLFSNGLVRNIADFYDLSYEKLIGLEKKIINENDRSERVISFQNKTVLNILNGIDKSKEVSFERVLFALGIRFVGETTAKKLALQFKNIHDLCNATYEELIAVEDVGTKVAQSIVHYFLQPENLEIILRLEKAGLCFKADEQKSVIIENVLDGAPIVVSGIFSIPREELKVLIEKYGGKNVTSISKNTKFLIVGDNMGPEKRKKADKLGVRMISEDEFYAILKLN